MKHNVAAGRQKSLVGSFCPLKPSPRAIFLCKDYNYNLLRKYDFFPRPHKKTDLGLAKVPVRLSQTVWA